MKRYISILAVSFLFMLIMPSVYAQEACQPLYGGGVTENEYCPTPTPEEAPDAQQPQEQDKPVQNGQTTKGGLPVKEPSQTDTTPDTGSAALGLLGLLPIGAIGLYFRHKARA